MKKTAFTLAEVLITLGVIGVVAAITMPTLIQKQREKEYTAKLKKFYSTMNQALQTTISEEGEISEWGLTYYSSSNGLSEDEIAQSYESRNLFLSKILKHMKVIYRCAYGESCKSESTYTRYSLGGTEFGTFSTSAILADGTSFLDITIISPSCTAQYGTSKQLQNVCGEIFVDLNGKNPPNATGKDVFLFYYTKFGLVPMGTAAQTKSYTFEDYCNKSKPHYLNGYGCTAWVIFNENMDYLHCNDLSWTGKTKCK